MNYDLLAKAMQNYHKPSGYVLKKIYGGIKMKKIKQGTNYILLRILFTGVSTFVITLMIMFFTETPAYAGTEYLIDTTNVATLQDRLGIKATVVSGSAIGVDEEIITITLTENVDGAFYFKGPKGATYILNAAEHTISNSGNDGPIYVNGGVTVILKGNGTYRGGKDGYYTVQVESNAKLIIESGEFIAGAAFWFIRGSTYFRLADGYDYYTATKGGENLFVSHNRKEKINTGSITFFDNNLKVSQHRGDVPTHNIVALPPSTGSYELAVNGLTASSEITAKVDDTITVTINPDLHYRVLKTIVKEESGKVLLTKYGNSFNFDMPNSDIIIEVSFEWFNQITSQPTPENPIVVTNNPAGVISHQWYIDSLVDFVLVNGTAGTGEESDVSISAGSYDPTLKTWSGNPEIRLYYYRFYREGDKIIVSDIIGDIESCNGTLQTDGTYIIETNYIDIQFNDPGGSCKITWRGLDKVPVEGQTSDTYTGPSGKVNVKVTFSDDIVLTSDEINYGEASPLTYAVTVNNGLGDGDYLEGATVSITSDSPAAGKKFKEWTVVKGAISLASSTGASITFTMPAEEVEVTATYEDIPPPTPINPTTPTTPSIAAPTPTPIPEGKVETTHQQDKGAPAVNINNSSEELKATVLTSEEQKRVKAGEDARIILQITDISSTINDEEKKLIYDKLASDNRAEDNAVVDNGASDQAVLYIDFTLYKQIGKQEQTKVTETKEKISISIEVPEELRNTDEVKSREFYVLRIHNGEVTRLNGSYDADKHIFTFETDRFSTYALTYQDTIRIQTYNGFRYLQLKAKAGKTSITLSYKRKVQVDGYLILGGKCGEDMVELADLPAKTTSYTVKKLKQGTYYKYQVKAYRMIDGDKVFIMTSKVVHTITESKTYANPTRVTTDTTSLKLEIGESETVTSQVVLPKSKKMKDHTAVIRYESSNKEIASVNKKGKILAKTKGTCYLYAYAQNGVYKRIKVTVE